MKDLIVRDIAKRVRLILDCVKTQAIMLLNRSLVIGF
jgi:hypothetical protein